MTLQTLTTEIRKEEKEKEKEEKLKKFYFQ